MRKGMMAGGPGLGLGSKREAIKVGARRRRDRGLRADAFADASLPCAAKPRAVSGKRLAVGIGKHSGLRFPFERYAPATRHPELPPAT